MTDEFLEAGKLKIEATNVCHNCGTVMVRARFEIEGGWILAWLCECEEEGSVNVKMSME